jgi:DNA-binding NarL/FixJ family response regulator
MDVMQLTIAIADDNRTAKMVLRHFLNKCKCKVVIEAENGRDLIAQIEKASQLPNMCLVDINMPEMDGFETTRQLKEKWPFIKVLALTENGSVSDICKMQQLGAEGCVSKLTTAPELDAVIKRLFENE